MADITSNLVFYTFLHLKRRFSIPKIKGFAFKPVKSTDIPSFTPKVMVMYCLTYRRLKVVSFSGINMLNNIQHIYTTILISCQIVCFQSYCFMFVFGTTSIFVRTTITRQKTMLCLSSNTNITNIIPTMTTLLACIVFIKE
jgi:hypothetical protein